MPTRLLTGRVGLVTGGGSGLGRAIAKRLARGGATVIVADQESSGAHETAEQIVGSGARARAITLDVTDSVAVDTEIAALHAEFGARFDCLVNNAGIDRGASLVEVSDESWQRVLAVNCTAPMYTMRAFVRCLLRDGARDQPADIVNVSSISAITVGADAAAYNSSKAALTKLTEVAQREALEHGWPVRVHGLMPSAMNTPMMAQWHLAENVMMAPDTVASAVEFMVTLPQDTFVQNVIITSRQEPGWPR